MDNAKIEQAIERWCEVADAELMRKAEARASGAAETPNGSHEIALILLHRLRRLEQRIASLEDQQGANMAGAALGAIGGSVFGHVLKQSAVSILERVFTPTPAKGEDEE